MTSVRSKPRKNVAPTAYMVLGVPPSLPSEKIHDRYLDLAFELHPDRGGDADKFTAVALAWAIINSTEKRRLYDARLKLEGNQCVACEGKGLKWRFKNHGEAPCEACKGTGQKKQ